jgi:hypothetical protein
MSRSVTQDNAESLARERARQARAQEGHVQRVEQEEVDE